MAKTHPTTNSIVEIKNYPEKLIHRHKSAESGETCSVSFFWNNKWASFWVNPEAVSQSVTRKGESLKGKMTISLGNPEDVRTISVQESDSSYKRQPMFNRTILAEITNQRENYLKSIAI